MIYVPQASRSLVRSVLTVAWVPIGINTGVSKVPCGVWSRPKRAWLCASVWRSSKVSGIPGFPPQRSSKTSLSKIFETREFTPKSEAYDTRWAIPLFGDVNFSDALLGAIFGVIDFITIDEPDNICILFNSPRFAQIGQLGFRRLTLFHRPAELRERNHRDIQLFSQSFEGTGNAGNFLLATLRTAAQLHELQIVHNDEGQVPQFHLQAPRFGTDIQR